MKKILFKDLMVGQEFDWCGPDVTPSFTQPCQKVSTRKYRTTGGGPIREYLVGTTSAQVFNVKPVQVS